MTPSLDGTVTDDELLASYPDVRLDHDNAPQWRGFLQHRFLVNRCGRCQWWHDPPRAVCPRCWATDVEPTAISGAGTIAALTHLHGVSSADPDPAGDAPWPLAAVELREQPGLRVVGHLVGPGADGLGIGDAVRLTWVDDGAATRPAFEAG